MNRNEKDKVQNGASQRKEPGAHSCGRTPCRESNLSSKGVDVVGRNMKQGHTALSEDRTWLLTPPKKWYNAVGYKKRTKVPKKAQDAAEGLWGRNGGQYGTPPRGWQKKSVKERGAPQGAQKNARSRRWRKLRIPNPPQGVQSKKKSANGRAYGPENSLKPYQRKTPVATRGSEDKRQGEN